jgi:nucleoid-associated protein YgaU
MGRETKILLAILGLLAGVFMGVVSLKLFVPRPPVGTGPDVHVESEPLPLVDPPSFAAPFFEPPPIDSPLVANDDPYAARSSRFASSPSVEDVPSPSAFVIPAAYESAGDVPVRPIEPLATEHDTPVPIEPPAAAVMPAPIDLPARTMAPPYDPEPVIMSPPYGPVQGGTYEARDGDSWWSLAEQAYGDGRLYRALYAWNRSRDPRVSLVPGTRLDIPAAAQLGAAWSMLLPND